MDVITLGKSQLKSSRIAYGCWRILGVSEAATVRADHRASAKRTLLAAYEAGFTHFDHADVYCDGIAEEVFGEVLRETPGMREAVTITSKCGVRRKGTPGPGAPYRYDFSRDYIVQSCESSLKRLGVETIDLYLLHRPDYLGDPSEVAGAFEELKRAGKVREFGLSNFRPSQVAAYQRHCPMPLIVNQVEISIEHRHALDDGTLDQCLAESITPMAWSPLHGGRLTETLPIDINSPDHARRIGVRETLDEIARQHTSSRTAVALAWLLKHPAGILPIIGSTRPENIRDAAKAASLKLSRDEWYRLLEAARGERLP